MYCAADLNSLGKKEWNPFHRKDLRTNNVRTVEVDGGRHEMWTQWLAEQSFDRPVEEQ